MKTDSELSNMSRRPGLSSDRAGSDRWLFLV